MSVVYAVPAVAGGAVFATSESWPIRMRRAHPLLVQLVRFTVVGGAGTALNAVLFLLLRAWWSALPANLVALVISTVVSTEAHRRFTFGGSSGSRWRAHLQDAGTVAFYGCYSSGVLLLNLVITAPSAISQSVAVAAASILGGLARFLVLRGWVFTANHPGTTREELVFGTQRGVVDGGARTPAAAEQLPAGTAGQARTCRSPSSLDGRGSQHG